MHETRLTYECLLTSTISPSMRTLASIFWKCGKPLHRFRSVHRNTAGPVLGSASSFSSNLG